MPNSDKDNIEPVTGATIRDDSDMFGHLTRRNWSCLILDTAENLLPYGGIEGRELMYRLAQSVEAFSTAFGGPAEARIRTIYRDHYVKLSLARFEELYPKIIVPLIWT